MSDRRLEELRKELAILRKEAQEAPESEQNLKLFKCAIVEGIISREEEERKNPLC